MKFHISIAIVTVFFFFMASTSTVNAEDAPKTGPPVKPNVLFIFADDLAYNCINNMGNSEVQTPNLDRLAKQGTTFTHAYNMGAWGGAVCVASRTMLNTGQFIWRAHANMPKLKNEYANQKRLWSQRMESAGYETYMTGKWHVRAPADKVFGTTKHIRGGMPNQVPEGYHRTKSPDDKTWLPWDPKHGGFWKGGKHWSEVVADDSIEFLQTAKQSDNPFFMYIAFNAAHDPRQSPKEFVDRYPLDKIKVPQPFYEEYPHSLPMKKIRDEVLAPFPRTEYAVKVNRQEYYAIITHMDQQIGRILDSLEESGMADNTYIFFTADHGLAVGHHSLMGKQNMYDHSLRVPFYVAGPDIEKDQRNSAKIYMQDVMATSLELAGADSKGVQFTSLLPLLRGESKKIYESIFGCYMKTQRAVIVGDYKLIVYPGLKKTLLYNLKNDPIEANNLADDPVQADRIKELMAELRKLQNEMEDDVKL